MGCRLALTEMSTTWLGTREAAEELGITLRTLYRFIDEGLLPAYRFGRVIRLKAEDVAGFIEQSRVTPGFGWTMMRAMWWRANARRWAGVIPIHRVRRGSEGSPTTSQAWRCSYRRSSACQATINSLRRRRNSAR